MVVGSENTGIAMRRSTRVPAEIAVRVRSLDPGFQFEESCKTLLVNAQGCGFQSPRELPVGIALLFMIGNRQATATVLNSTALGEGAAAWVIGARLHRSGNFWGLASPPADWAEVAAAQPGPAMETATMERFIAEKIAGEVERQTEQLVSKLCEQMQELVASRESDFMALMAKEMEGLKSDITKQAADRAVLNLRETLQRFSQQLNAELQKQLSGQQKQVEECLAQLRSISARSSASPPEVLPESTPGTPTRTV